MATELSLPEQLLLLYLDDATGKTEELWTRSGLEGAILAELMLQGRIDLDEMKRLVVLDAAPTGDALLDQALGRIAETGRPRAVHEWVEKLIRDKPYPGERVLQAALSQRLVERGILTRKEERLVWVIPDPTYPTQDPTPERALRERLRSALLEDGPVDERLVVLITLLHSSEALDRVLSEEEVTRSAPRVKELCEDVAAGRGSGGAVSEAIRRRRETDGAFSLIHMADLIGCFLPSR